MSSAITYTMAQNLAGQNLKRFRLNLYLNGLDIGLDKEMELRDDGIIHAANYVKRERQNFKDTNFRVFDTKENTDFYDELFNSGNSLNPERIGDLEETIRSKFAKDFSFDQSISSDSWKLDGGNTEYEPEFWEWINTLNSGWQYYHTFRKFELYKEQARRWLNDTAIYDPQASEDAQVAWLKLEYERLRQNSLYGCNKYLWLKDNFSRNPKGLKYKAWKAQSFLMYLYDLYINCIIGKPRQIGFTSGLCGAGIIRTMVRRNFFCKMVATKGEKTEEIFRDKVKYAVDEFPDHMVPTISSDTGSQLWFVKKVAKGKTTGANSMFKVEPPTIYCINGGSPDQVFADEIGTYDILGDMMREGRPALFRVNPSTGKLEMKRHFMGWGTGGNMVKGGAAMEVEIRAAVEAWRDKDFGFSLMPVFLNAFCKEGFDKKFYETEKRYYYSKEHKVGDVDPKIQFHQAYPIVLEDMFLTSSDTLIPTSAINDMIQKSRQAERSGRRAKEKKYLRGHFVPIFDTSCKFPDDFDIPYKAIGARFVPSTDQETYENSPFACAILAEYPDHNWIHRWFQGTDPIFTSSGTSNMSSVIWDKLLNKPSCWIDGKTDDYRFMYLQCHLANLFYGQIVQNKSIGIPELIESNVGGEYMNYRKDRGYEHAMMDNFRIYSDVLKTRTSTGVGINRKGIRKGTNSPFLITELEELIVLYMENIKCELFWEQMKTFTRKTTTKTTAYEPLNKKFHRDDNIDAMNYAYICAKSWKISPRTIDQVKKQKKKKRRYAYDSNWNLTLTNVGING